MRQQYDSIIAAKFSSHRKSNAVNKRFLNKLVFASKRRFVLNLLSASSLLLPAFFQSCDITRAASVNICNSS
jgi:hypothetical protein